MRLLLDTHAFLWFILNDSRLSRHAEQLIADGANQIEVSPASYWEIAIKISLGKYVLPEPFAAFMTREMAVNSIRVLPIEASHAAAIADLKFHHRDPFDRLLIAQSLVEQIPIVSADRSFDAYGVVRMW